MRMSREEFEQHVLSAYEQLPQAARAALDEGNIDISGGGLARSGIGGGL